MGRYKLQRQDHASGVTSRRKASSTAFVEQFRRRGWHSTIEKGLHVDADKETSRSVHATVTAPILLSRLTPPCDRSLFLSADKIECKDYRHSQ